MTVIDITDRINYKYKDESRVPLVEQIVWSPISVDVIGRTATILEFDKKLHQLERKMSIIIKRIQELVEEPQP